MNLTLTCAVVGILAQAFSVLMNIYNTRIKARMANVQFKASEYFTEDWPRIAAILCILAIGLIMIPYMPKNWNPVAVIIGAGTVGYMGQDIALRVFSAVNSKINAAIDYKTDIADTQTGTLGTPTPAAKPNK